MNFMFQNFNANGKSAQNKKNAQNDGRNYIEKLNIIFSFGK